mgnify:CR=1 FL=1
MNRKTVCVCVTVNLLSLSQKQVVILLRDTKSDRKVVTNNFEDQILKNKGNI